MIALWGKRELTDLFVFLVCGLCTVCLGKFALLLCDIGWLCYVIIALSDHGLYCPI